MRAAFATACVDSAQIVRITLADNMAGGSTPTSTVVHTYPVAFAPFRVPFLKELEVAGTRVDSKTRWELRFPYGSDVQIKDRAIIGGLTYEVASPRTPRTNQIFVAFLVELVI